MKKIKNYIRSDTNIQFARYARKFQGFLLDQLDNGYVDFLHSQEMNPYSTCLYKEGNDLVWEVNVLTKEAEAQMASVLLGIESIQLRYGQESFKVYRQVTTSLSQEEMTANFYQTRSYKLHRLQFQTPTSFKQAGDYVYHPNVRLVLQSLLMKVNYLESGEFEVHSDLLEDLQKSVKIISYKLRSSAFLIHKVRIPSFVGEITIKVSGSETLNNYLSYLLHIGEYTGVGIKTSIGMGSLKYHQKED